MVPNYDKLNTSDIDIIMSSNVESVSINNIVTYTIIINNFRNLTITSSIISVDLSSSIKYKENSLKVNGKPKFNEDITRGILIEGINLNQTIIVTFDAIVVSSAPNNLIDAFALIKYNIYDRENNMFINNMAKSSPYIIKVISEDSPIEAINNYTATTIIDPYSAVDSTLNTVAFKEINLENVLVLSDFNIEIPSINSLKLSIKFLDHHITKTINGMSSNNIKSNNFTLSINALATYYLEYSANNSSQTMHSKTFEIVFSSFIVLPENYDDTLPIKLDYEIESIDYSQISNNKIYSSSLLLLFVNLK